MYIYIYTHTHLSLSLSMYIYIYIYIYIYVYIVVASSTGVFPLKILELSIESLDKQWFCRWSLEVLTAILRCFRSKSRPWNLKYKSIQYENYHNGDLKMSEHGHEDMFQQSRATFSNQSYPPFRTLFWGRWITARRSIGCSNNRCFVIVWNVGCWNESNIHTNIYMYAHIYIYIYTHIHTYIHTTCIIHTVHIISQVISLHSYVNNQSTHDTCMVAIFYPFSQFCEINISLLSLQTQPNTAPNLFQSGVEYGKYVLLLLLLLWLLLLLLLLITITIIVTNTIMASMTWPRSRPRRGSLTVGCERTTSSPARRRSAPAINYYYYYYHYYYYHYHYYYYYYYL